MHLNPFIVLPFFFTDKKNFKSFNQIKYALALIWYG